MSALLWQLWIVASTSLERNRFMRQSTTSKMSMLKRQIEVIRRPCF